MATTNVLIRHALLWLASLAVPLHGFPQMSCGCAVAEVGHKAIFERDGSCCSSERKNVENSCCAKPSTLVGDKSCCRKRGSGNSRCQCGADCQCGTSQNPQPAVPPAPNTDLTQKLLGISLAVSTVGLNYRPRTCRDYQDATNHIDSDSATAKCVLLCRFTL